MVIGPTPPGTGVIAPATFHGGVKIHIPHQAGPRRTRSARFGFDAVDSHINHRRARFNPIPFNHLRHAHRRHENVGAPAHRRQVSGFGNG